MKFDISLLKQKEEKIEVFYLEKVLFVVRSSF